MVLISPKVHENIMYQYVKGKLYTDRGGYSFNSAFASCVSRGLLRKKLLHLGQTPLLKGFGLWGKSTGG